MESVQNRLRLGFIQNYEYRRNIKQQFELTFIGIHKSYENCDSYVFRQSEVLLDKPLY